MDQPASNPASSGISWGPTAAFLVVAADFALITLLPRVSALTGFELPWGQASGFLARAILAAGFTGYVLFSLKAKPGALGIAIGSPREGLRASAVASAGVAVLLAAAAGTALALRAAGKNVLPAPSAPAPLPVLAERIAWNLLAYPVLEEWIYRGILLPPLEKQAGRGSAIVLSGLVFQALHLAYGIYLPHYFLGGMILAWAFFRSGSLLVPIGLHAAWNLLVIAVETSRASGWISF